MVKIVDFVLDWMRCSAVCLGRTEISVSAMCIHQQVFCFPNIMFHFLIYGNISFHSTLFHLRKCASLGVSKAFRHAGVLIALTLSKNEIRQNSNSWGILDYGLSVTP